MVKCFYILLVLVCGGMCEMCKRTLRSEYQPFGAIMCKGVCGCQSAVPMYTKNSLSCRCRNVESAHSKDSTKLSTSSNMATSAVPCHKKKTTTTDHLPKCPRPLVKACEYNKIEDIMRQVEPPEKANCRISKFQSLVMHTVQNGLEAAFVILAQIGADLCFVDSHNGEDLVHKAIRTRDVDMVKCVLDTGYFNINMKHQIYGGIYPISLAANLGNIEVFDYLLNHGAKANVIDERNLNILHFACRLWSHPAMVHHILDLNITGLNKNGESSSGHTPVMLAAQRCHTSTVRVLQDAGCIMGNSKNRYAVKGLLRKCKVKASKLNK